MLRYPAHWPASPPQEEGVDVALATDLVSLMLRDECDVAVIASADSDEAYRREPLPASPRAPIIE